jgi:hypothetical protein
MARSHKGVRQPAPPVETPPAHEIEEEVADDVDPEDGTISEDKAEELGAVNAEAVQANRVRKEAVGKKRSGNGKRVAWGQDNACLLYDTVIEMYPPASMAVHVQRLTGGSPATWYLQSQPLNGRELYDHVMAQCHGRAGEAQYKISLVDAHTQAFRGIGRLTLPSTIGMAGQPAPIAPQQPMPQYAPPAQPAPPQGLGWPPGPFYTTPAGAPAAAPAAPIAAAPVPAGVDITRALELQKQLTTMHAQLEALLQGRAAPPAPPPPAAPVLPQQLGSPFAIPPGHVLMLTPTGQQVLMPTSQVGIAGAPPPAAAAAAPPPQAPQTPAQQFAASIGMMQSAFEAATQIQRLVPQAPAPAAAAPEKPEDEDYIKHTKVGEMHIVQNKHNGDFLPFETFIANGDKIMGWVKEQATIIRGGQPQQQANGAPQAQAGQLPAPAIPVQGP